MKQIKLLLASLLLVPIVAFAQIADECKDAGDLDRCMIVLNGIKFARFAQTSVIGYRIVHGMWPSSNNQVNPPTPEDYKTNGVSSIAITNNGTIFITYDDTLNNKTIMITPTEMGNKQIHWNCRGGTLPQEFRPAQCRV